jgi:hypothetical protein
MTIDSGFAEPEVTGDDLEGGEGDNGAPKLAFERSPLRVLASLEHRPLQQAMKAIEYIDASQERQRRFLKACTPIALNLIAQNGPEYLSAVQAIQS